MLAEETLKDLSFAKGKILVATEETSKIERWIKLEVHGEKYDVLVKEESSCVFPKEIGKEFWPPQILGEANKTVEFLQYEGGRATEKGTREVEDDDM